MTDLQTKTLSILTAPTEESMISQINDLSERERLIMLCIMSKAIRENLIEELKAGMVKFENL